MLTLLTVVHTLLSFVALVVGVFVVARLLKGDAQPGSFWLFWITALATSVTGFFFPYHGMTPALVVGVLAIIILVLVLLVHQQVVNTHFSESVVITGLAASEYLLAFVAVAQAFTKIPLLHDLAPTLKEVPFSLTQATVLLAFSAICVVSIRRNRKLYTP